jgi:ribosome maturation factor RimP
MISREAVEDLVSKYIGGTGLFLVDIHVSPSDNIRVLVDSNEGVNLNECVELSRALENGLNRDENDFQLEVSSPGLTEPLKVLPQYKKNIGRRVEIITREGSKHEGTLTAVTTDGLLIEEEVKVREGKKRPGIKSVEKEFEFDQIFSTKVVVSYK